MTDHLSVLPPDFSDVREALAKHDFSSASPDLNFWANRCQELLDERDRRRKPVNTETEAEAAFGPPFGPEMSDEDFQKFLVTALFHTESQKQIHGIKIDQNGLSHVAIPTWAVRRALWDWRCDHNEVARLEKLINTPELLDFLKAVQIEAVHQRERWGSDHDAGKTAPDWFWLLGYLAGKALHADKAGARDKMLHHIITTAAACANWHAQILGTCDMRPGIEPPHNET